MNNLKKIGLTALGSSLIATSAFAGALDVTGSAGIGLANQENKSKGNGFSMGDEVTFSGSGEMDNGWTVTASFQLDSSETATGNMDNRSVKLEMPGMGTLTFSGHGGSSAMGAVDDVMPTAYGETWDILAASDEGEVEFGAIGSAGSNNSFYYTNSDLMDGVKVGVSYTPSDGTTEVESSTDVSVEYTGYEGLTVGYAAGEDNAAGSTSNTDNETMYIKYVYGSFTAGYQESEIDSGSQTTSDDFEAMGVTYAVTDELSVGYGTSSYDAGDKSEDQETTNISFSYTMGSMTFAGAFVDQTNRGGGTATQDDIKGYALDVSFAF
jgi:outer membrane protein OmpU